MIHRLKIAEWKTAFTLLAFITIQGFYLKSNGLINAQENPVDEKCLIYNSQKPQPHQLRVTPNTPVNICKHMQINESNIIFLGTFYSETTYVDVYESKPDSARWITYRNIHYERYKVYIDSSIIGQTDPGALIQMDFYSSVQEGRYRPRINDKGDSTTEGELFRGFGHFYEYHFSKGSRAFFIGNYIKGTYTPKFVGRLDSDCMAELLKCVKFLQLQQNHF